MRRVNIEILKENANLTVGELLTKLEEEQNAIQQKEDKEYEELKSKYNNVYLKGITNSIIFGKTLEVINITEIVSRERTTDWNYIYKFNGNKISFSKRDINKRTINDHLDIEKLNTYEIITEEEYNVYVDKYKQLSKELEVLINYKIF